MRRRSLGLMALVAGLTVATATALEAPIPYRQKNLQLLCSHCNRLKGNRDQAYLMARLKEMAVI